MLNPDYRDMLSAFEEAGVEYLVVGAYALAAHGQPRATGDIDLWVRPSLANAEQVMQALQEFGAPLKSVSVKDFQTPGMVFQIGVTPRRIDILTSIDGVEFDAAWKERLEVEIDEVLIPVLSREHVIQNKRALGRAQDRADIEKLEGEDGEEAS